jgi:hypothetical protein
MAGESGRAEAGDIGGDAGRCAFPGGVAIGAGSGPNVAALGAHPGAVDAAGSTLAVGGARHARRRAVVDAAAAPVSVGVLGAEVTAVEGGGSASNGGDLGLGREP